MGHSHGSRDDNNEPDQLDKLADAGKETLQWPNNELGRLFWKSFLPLVTAEGMDRLGQDLPTPLQSAGIGASSLPMYMEYLIPDLIEQIKGGETADAMMTGLTSAAMGAGAITGDNELVKGGTFLNIFFQLAGMFEEMQEQDLEGEIERLENRIPHHVERWNAETEEWEQDVDAHDIEKGDIVRVQPGAMIPFDADVIAIDGEKEDAHGFADSRIISGQSILSNVDTAQKSAISQGAYVAGGDRIQSMRDALDTLQVTFEAYEEEDIDRLTDEVEDLLTSGQHEEALKRLQSGITSLSKLQNLSAEQKEALGRYDSGYFNTLKHEALGKSFTIQVNESFEASELMHNISAVKKAAESGEHLTNRETNIDKFANKWIWLMTGFVGTQFGIELFKGKGNDGKLTGEEISNGIRKSLELAIKMAPCPLMASGLSYPFMIRKLSGSYGINLASKGALERISEVDTVVFDMTGPLTQGKPEILTDESLSYRENGSAIDASDSDLEAELMMEAAKLEQFASHPVANAIQQYAADLHGVERIIPDENEVNLDEEDTKEAKSGIAGAIGDAHLSIGSARYITEKFGTPVPQEIQDQMQSLREQGRVVSLMRREKAGNVTWKVLSFDDPVRETTKDDKGREILGAKDTIAKLQSEGKRVIIATGDSQERAEIIARQLGLIDDNMSRDEIESIVRGDQKGTDKEEIVRSLQDEEGKKVLMVGDGNNDANALSKAHVSLAIKNMGGRLAEAAAQGQINHIGEIPGLINISRDTNQHVQRTSLFAKLWMGFLTATHLIGIKIGPVFASVLHELPTAAITWIAGNSTQRIATKELGEGNGSTDMSFTWKQATEFEKGMINAVGPKVGLAEKDKNLADASEDQKSQTPADPTLRDGAANDNGRGMDGDSQSVTTR